MATMFAFFLFTEPQRRSLRPTRHRPYSIRPHWIGSYRRWPNPTCIARWNTMDTRRGLDIHPVRYRNNPTTSHRRWDSTRLPNRNRHTWYDSNRLGRTERRVHRNTVASSHPTWGNRLRSSSKWRTDYCPHIARK